MKKTIYIPVILAAALSCSREETPVIVPEPLEAHREATITDILDSPAAIEGSVYVLLDDELAGKVERGTADAASLGMASMQRVFPDAGKFEPRSRDMGMHRWYDVTLPEGTTLRQAHEILSSHAHVDNVCPKFRMRRLMDNPNDTYYSLYQWHYSNVRTADVWRDYTVGSPDVIVSVVDEGVDMSHPDLADIVLAAGSNGSRNFVKSNYNITITRGDTGHGTHVAGTIAAINNNGAGCCGMAGGDAAAGKRGVRIMSCQVFEGDYSASDANFAAAIKWGADHGAVISNNSWGYTFTNEETGEIYEDTARNLFNNFSHPDEGRYTHPLKAAIDYFVKYAGYDEHGEQTGPMAGGLVFFSAGNDGDVPSIASLGAPANYSSVIAVGATNRNDIRAYYSDYGDYVDICAPGGDGLGQIFSTLPRSIAPSGYGYMLGTSMACPHVSGGAALLASYFGGPGFTAGKCREYLLEGARAITTDHNIGPLMDVYSSIEYGIMEGSGATVTLPTISTEYSGEWTLKAYGKMSATYEVRGFGITVSTEAGSPAAKWSSTGKYYTLSIDAIKADAGTYTARISATNKAGTVTLEIPYTILPNHAPTVSSPIGNLLLDRSGSAKIEVTNVFSDEDEDVLEYKVTTSGGSLDASVSNGIMTITAPNQSGLYTLTVTASDILGASVSDTFQLTVLSSSTGVIGYPNPMKDVLNVVIASTGATADIAIYGAAGGTVYKETMTMDAFTPHVIDVSGLAPGRYTLVATYDGKKYTQTLSKH